MRGLLYSFIGFSLGSLVSLSWLIFVGFGTYLFLSTDRLNIWHIGISFMTPITLLSMWGLYAGGLTDITRRHKQLKRLVICGVVLVIAAPLLVGMLWGFAMLSDVTA